MTTRSKQAPPAVAGSVAIVGRPNVGKSTLFNRLCGTRRALMSSEAGTTRDWIEGFCHWNGRVFRVIDTGGYDPGTGVILASVCSQVERWVREADVVVWVVDADEGLTPPDEKFSRWLRPLARRVVVAVNKADDAKKEAGASDFYRLGFETTVSVSAAHGRRMNVLLEALEPFFDERKAPAPVDAMPVAILGRPNVGKSSLVNQILGEERMIVSEIPGTTRDSIDSLVLWEDRRYLFVDTAGLRAKKSKADDLEGLTRIMSERALEHCHVALLLIDAGDAWTDGDIAVARLIDENKRAVVVGVNKWDLVKDPGALAAKLRDRLPIRLPFMPHAPLAFLSAKTGQNIPELMTMLADAHEQYHRKFDGEELNDFFWREVQERPFTQRGRKLVMHHAEQVDSAPPTILIRTSLPAEDVHFSYRRHLESVFRKAFGVAATPVVFRFRQGKA